MIPRPFTPLPPRSPWRERISDMVDALVSILFVGGVIAIVALLVCIAFFSLASVAHASDASRPRTARSVAVLHEFKRANPCPSPEYNPARPMRCPGYVADHVEPLACGGADAPGNMQWQTKAAARAKDTWERVGCAHGRRHSGLPITRDDMRLAQR